MYGLLFSGVRLTFDCRIGERLLNFKSVHPPGAMVASEADVPAAKLDLAKEFAASADAAYSGYCGPLSASSARHHLAGIGSASGTCVIERTASTRNVLQGTSARASHPRRLRSNDLQDPREAEDVSQSEKR